MSATASQITVTSLAFARGFHQRPVYSPHKGSATRKMFQFDDHIMTTQTMNHTLAVSSQLLEIYKIIVFMIILTATMKCKVHAKVFCHGRRSSAYMGGNYLCSTPGFRLILAFLTRIQPYEISFRSTGIA